MTGVTQIHTTGYPRSGNTWLGYLLSDMLDCAWVQMGPGDPPLYKGDDDKRNDAFAIYKHHAGIKTWPTDAKTFFVYRDPRDVCVSVMYYAKSANLWEALLIMQSPSEFFNAPSYEDMIAAWWNKPGTDFQCRYEDLHEAPVETLFIAAESLGVYIHPARIEKAVQRQEFNRVKAQDPARLGHAMRRGKTGDWREHFNRDFADYFNTVYGDILLMQGYIKDRNWWKDVPG